MQGSDAKPRQIQSGDTVILPRCGAHRLRDSQATEWSHSNQISWFDGAEREHSDRADKNNQRSLTTIIVCRFRKPNRESDVLLGALPEQIVFRRPSTGLVGGPESTISVLEHEVAHSPISPQIVEHLIKAAILQATRSSSDLPSARQNTVGAPLNDQVIARALSLIHSRPDMAWTVASLATAVGVSRSTFAARFVDRIGVTPLNYLRRERMHKAAEMLGDKTLGIKEISAAVGYDSESAFNNAFKQWSGVTPGLFRRNPSR